MRKRLIAVMLVALLCMGMSMTAYAVPQITPEEQPPAEATEEEAQAFKAAQLKKYYDMPVLPCSGTINHPSHKGFLPCRYS